MRMGIRAAVAALLLVLFYGLLGVVTWFGVLIVRRALVDPTYGGGQRVFMVVFGLLFVMPAVRVVHAAVRRRVPIRSGVAVGRAGQPELWEFVEGLAGACGVAVPTRIVVTGEANAAAVSSAALFGTLRRDRTVYLGLPLLAGLDASQAAAVVCHELGHHASGDSRLAALTYRSGDALLATLRGGRLWLLGWLTDGLFAAFAGLYFSVTFAVRRRQELGADQLAARVAGAEAAVTALESVYLIDVLYLAFLRGGGSAEPTASSAERAAERAADPAGFREFFDDHVGSLALEIRHNRGNAFDSHPPLSERVAALRRTGHQPAIAISAGRAIELLRAPDEVARALVGAGRAQRRR
jgi:Zn-dependent protease with chaperone function